MKLNSVEQARKTQNQEDIQEAETIEEEMNRKIFSKKGISIIKHNPCVDSKGNNTICGTIVNSTTSPAKNITIKIELYDGNKNFIAFTEAKIYHLEAKTKFDFQAPVFYDTAVDYKIIKISSN